MLYLTFTVPSRCSSGGTGGDTLHQESSPYWNWIFLLFYKLADSSKIVMVMLEIQINKHHFTYNWTHFLIELGNFLSKLDTRLSKLFAFEITPHPSD